MSNPEVQLGDTIRAIRLEGENLDLHELYDGQFAIVTNLADADGDIRAAFAHTFFGNDRWYVSEWELATSGDVDLGEAGLTS